MTFICSLGWCLVRLQLEIRMFSLQILLWVSPISWNSFKTSAIWTKYLRHSGSVNLLPAFILSLVTMSRLGPSSHSRAIPTRFFGFYWTSQPQTFTKFGWTIDTITFVSFWDSSNCSSKGFKPGCRYSITAVILLEKHYTSYLPCDNISF